MRNATITALFLLLASCTKTKIVAPIKETKPSIYNTWHYNSDSIVIDSFYFNGGTMLTPFKMSVQSDSIFKVFSDKSTLLMYTYRVTKDSLYLHSYTVSSRQFYAFTKHN
jgi:hypothetical protein